VLRIVVCEVDQTTLIIPHVFAVDGQLCADRHRHARRDADVVFNEDRLRATVKPDDEPLVCAVGSRLVAQEPLHDASGGNFNAARVPREGVRDLIVPLQRRTADGTEGKDQCEEAALSGGLSAVTARSVSPPAS